MGRRFSAYKQPAMEGVSSYGATAPGEYAEEYKSVFERIRNKATYGIGIAAASGALFLSSACGPGEAERVGPASAESAQPEASPTTIEYNEQNVPLKFKGKEYMGTEAFTKASEVLVADHPEPTEAVRHIINEKLNTWANWAKTQAGNPDYKNYESTISQQSGTIGILDDFIKPSLTEALTSEYSETPDARPYAATNLTDYVSSIAYKVNYNAQQNPDYKFSFVIDRDKPDNGVLWNFNIDDIYAFHLYLGEKDNAAELGLPEEERLDDRNQWLLVMEKQENEKGDLVWKIVETKNIDANYDE